MKKSKKTSDSNSLEVGGHFPLLFIELASMYPKSRHFENISENFKKQIYI